MPEDYRDDLVDQEALSLEFQDFYLKKVEEFERLTFGPPPTHRQRATLRLICEFCYFKGSARAWKVAGMQQAESIETITAQVKETMRILHGEK